MARTQRLLFSGPFVVALVASCSGSGGGGSGEDPRGVTEKVSRLVQGFSFGNGPYATLPAGDGKVFGPSQAGAFEGADSPGIVRPPSIDGGVYDRASACDALCDFVANCFSVAVPANCGATCDAQLRATASEYGVECTSAVLDLYSCVASALVCGGGASLGDEGDEGEAGDDDDDDDDDGDIGERAGFGLAPDFLNRCASSIAGLLACAGPELDDEEVLLE